MKDLLEKLETLKKGLDKKKIAEFMTTLKSDAEKLCKDYNQAIIEKDKSIIDIDKDIIECVGAYNNLAKHLCFIECSETEDPMIEAIKRITVKIIRTKDVKEGELKITKRSIVDSEQEIDLYKLHNFVKDGIGYEKDWFLKVEKLNLLATLCLASDLGYTASQIKELDCSYAMRDLSREKEVKGTLLTKEGKVAAVSKREWLRALTDVVQSMMGENYKPINHDVTYLLNCLTSKGKKVLTVNAANHRQLRTVLLNICHRIATEKHYSVNARLKK